MSIRKILLICFLWVPVCQQALAQVKFSTVVNQKEIGKNDYLQVEYIVENANTVEQITAPSFPGFTVSSGPMQQSGMSVINGSVTKYEGVTFVLQPTSTGRKVIPGATAMVDGKQMKSNSVVVQVTNVSSQTPSQSLNPSPFNLDIPDIVPDINEEYVLRPGENVNEKIKNNLLVRLDVSKTSCYIGEPIIATYKLCSRLKSESKVTRRPTLNGFSVYDMIQPESNSPTVEKIGGKMFNVHVIRKVQLYPLQEGSFELDPAELDNTVRFVRVEGNGSRGSMRQLMDDYYSGMAQGKLEEEHITLASKPVTITVKPLPETGKPLSFDGAVGKFSISAAFAKKEIAADETGELDVLLKGDGNITMINAPGVTWPTGAEAYEPTVKEDINKMVSPINGTKRFQYPFTVKAPGTVLILPVEFSYFDPSANAYKTIHSDSLLLRVTKAAHPVKKAIADKIDKILPPDGFNWLKLLWLLPVLIVIALAFVVNKRNRKKPVVKPQPVAPVVVKDPFEAARIALQSGDSVLFYKEMGRSIWNKLAEKLPVTSSQLNKPVVTRLLRQRAVPETTIAALENILLETEMALYTPVHSTHDMKASLERAESVVSKLDREIS